ncbi:TERF1-interacting nuclear factor 2 isoform X2 [Candoia aspera]|uniref:TERF1-interacting nuclear factor 2 isoform X2 n=1 Tax=Candoia aspera TaxID=51853 RepID=UPI002FD7B918
MGDDGEEEGAAAAAAAAEGPAPAAALRLVAAAAWHVVRQRRAPDFARALAFLEAVGQAAPDLVPFQHLAKLRLGLQAKIIMNMLQEKQPHGKIYDALDAYFPESESQLHPKATAQDLELVQTAQENFRVLVLGLLSDSRHEEKYVQEHLENDYGESFLQVVEELFKDYLWQLEHTLPKPCFQQLLQAASIQGLSQPPQPSASILSQYLTAMGYQWAGCPEPSSSPHRSVSPCQCEEDSLGASQPFSPPPGRGRRENCLSCLSEENSQGHHAVHRQTDAAGDFVPDSESEGGSSPFKGEYQGTRHRTLIPTFQEHLGDSGSQ